MAARKKFQRLRDGRCRFQYVDPLTGRRGTFVGTEAECEAKHATLGYVRGQKRLGVSAIELRAREPSSQDRRTLNDLFRVFVRRATAASARVYLNHWQVRIAPALGKLCAWELLPDILYEWAGKLADAYAPNTIKASAELVLMVAKTARLPNRPWEGFRLRRATPRRQRRALASVTELDAVLMQARDEDQQHWQKGEEAFLGCSVLVATLTGLRNAELAGLSWRDLRLDAEGSPPLITIARQAPRNWHLDRAGKPNGKTEPDSPTKGRRIDTLALHQDAAKALRMHREQLQKAGMYDARGPVFPDEHGFWRTSGSVIRPEKVAELVRKAGLPYESFTTHELRHTYCTLQAMYALRHGTGDAVDLQRKMRHANVATTYGYIQSVGVGITPSAIPALSVQMVPAISATEAENEPPELGTLDRKALIRGLEQLRGLRSGNVRAPGAIVKTKKPTLREIADGVLALPSQDREPLPDDVRELARSAYQRAYRRAIGRKKSPEAARIAGRRAQNMLLMGWARALGKGRDRQARALPAHEPQA